MKSSRFKHSFNRTGVAVVTAVLFGSIGTYMLRSSSALSTNNPAGIADSCQLEGTNTVLYGWGYDPNPPTGVEPYVTVQVGGSAATVATNEANYRLSAINDWINYNYGTDAPKTGAYGWRLQLSGLYKGTTYVVSGTVLNYGAGGNTPLGVNTTHNVDGNASKPYFAGGKIPDACLTTKPAPAPAPAPKPAPAAPKPTTPKVTTPAAPAPPALSKATDATVTAGTTAITFRAPTGNATGMYVLYGTNEKDLNRSSEQQPVSGAEATLTLKGLTAKTTYYYQLVRTRGTETAPSATTSFTTKGYNISLTFVGKDEKPTAGIVVDLEGQKQTSSKAGSVTFTNLASGAYSATFTYNGQLYSQDFNTNTSTGDEPKVLAVSRTVNLDMLKTTSSTAKPVADSSSPLPIVFVSAVMALLVGGGIWWALVRHKHRKKAAQALFGGTGSPDIIDRHVHEHFLHQKPVAHEPAPAHMGESLRDMVVLSMAEEAKKKKQPPTQPQP
jgi:hypothetical protein